MTPAECYLEFLAITRHFNSSYDYFKYGGKVNVKRATFDARPDRWMFEKLSRKHDAKWMIIGACLAGKKWIGDMVSEEAEEIAAKRLKNVQSLAYTVKNDLEKLTVPFDAAIEVPPGHIPLMIHMVLSGNLQVETLAAVVGLTNCDGYWVSQGDPMLTKMAVMARKYYPFMQMDKEKIKRVVVDACSQSSV